MANQNDDSKATGKDTDILDSDELLDLDMALDDLNPPDEGLVDDSLSDALEDMPEHSATEAAQQAAELATKSAQEAEAKAVSEAEAAKSAKAAAEEAMAAALAAEEAAKQAQAAAKAQAVAQTKAAEQAKAAMQAEAKAKAESEAKAKAEAEAKAKAEAEAKARAEAEAKAKAEAEAKARAEAEAKAKAESEAKAKAEAEAKAKAEAEAKAKAEAEAKAKAEAEAKAKAEAEAKAKEESAKMGAMDGSENFMDMNLDDDLDDDLNDEIHDSALETLSSLEEELSELADWDDSVDEIPAITTNETTHLQTPAKAPEVPVAPEEPVKTKEEPVVTEKENKKGAFGAANSVLLSFGLISIIIAALAIWLSLDTSQQAANLASAHLKQQEQVEQMEKHQEKQTILLQQQIENLQQQLKILTNVISNKQTEQWQNAIEKPALKTATEAEPVKEELKAAEAAKKVVKKTVVNKIAPTVSPEAVKKVAPKQAVTTAPKTAAIKSISKAAVKLTPLSSPYAAEPGSVQGWVVYLFSSASQESAEREARQFRGKKINAKYVRTISKGKVWYHVLVSGFATERKAAAFKKFVKEYHGIDAWYNKSANKITNSSTKQAAKIINVASNPKAKQAAVANKTAKAIVRHNVRFQAIKSEVWLQVSAPNKRGTAKGKLLKEVLLKPGHHITLKVTSDSVWITAGNAPALSIKIDDKLVSKSGSLGNGKKVLRNYRVKIKK